MPDPDSADDTAVPPDPFEAELVAYLDGELGEDDARRVEARLAADPSARARAAALKGTFDLLDYLPQPPPSPTFASRTLDRLPTASGGAGRPAVAGSASATAPLPPAADPAPVRWGRWAAGILLASAASAAAAYLAAAAARPYLFPAPDDLPISDHRAVALLPLYAPADDLDYVRELARPEFFGDDPAVDFDPSLRPPHGAEPDAPTGPGFDTLAAEFKALPPARRDAVRDLDRQLHALDPAARDHLLRVLEVYALWLDRLSDPERRAVLAATTPRGRLDEVRKVRGQQWFDGLPEAQRRRLNDLPADRRDQAVVELRQAEARRRDDWAFVRRHAPDIVANRVPWPFDDDKLRAEVEEFARAAFRTDDPKKTRLTPADFERHAAALNQAREKKGWAWHAYGRVVHEFTSPAAPPPRRYELLPEPVGEPVTRPDQLGELGKRVFEKGAGMKAVQDKVGRWPDFALAVHGYAAKAERLGPLGPARPVEFREPLRAFVTGELVPALSPADAKALAGLEGRWPEYPRKVVELARQYDLAAPGLMPPGSPKKWEALYGPRGRPGS
ncbi:MAG: hypothetical protein C0501_10775 [Isosphaera sp.]|nr:hypothetical protein [Isosphaera sp.]